MGKCPSTPSGLLCLSDGECNKCKLILGSYQSCDVTSSTPVCDADSTTAVIDDTATTKLAVCKGCTKTGW